MVSTLDVAHLNVARRGDKSAFLWNTQPRVQAGVTTVCRDRLTKGHLLHSCAQLFMVDVVASANVASPHETNIFPSSTLRRILTLLSPTRFLFVSSFTSTAFVRDKLAPTFTWYRHSLAKSTHATTFAAYINIYIYIYDLTQPALPKEEQESEGTSRKRHSPMPTCFWLGRTTRPASGLR